MIGSVNKKAKLVAQLLALIPLREPPLHAKLHQVSLFGVSTIPPTAR